MVLLCFGLLEPIPSARIGWQPGQPNVDPREQGFGCQSWELLLFYCYLFIYGNTNVCCSEV